MPKQWKLPPAGPDIHTQRCLNGYGILGVDRFDVGIGHYNADGGKGAFWSKGREHNLTRAQVARRLDFLRHKNGTGAEIYIRPHGLANWPFVFLDDLTDVAAREIAEQYRALVIETSEGSFHALVQTERSLSPRERHVAQTLLLERLNTYSPDGGGDPSSTAGNKFSRLAGFTNNKPNRKRVDGKPVWVNVVATPGAATKVLAISALLVAANGDADHSAVTSIPPRPAQRETGRGGGGGAAVSTTSHAGTARLGRPGRLATGRDTSDSADDYRKVCKRLRGGEDRDDVERWLADYVRRRPRRQHPGEAERYAAVTVAEACRIIGLP